METKNVIAALNAINPMLGVVLHLVSTALEAKRAFLKANPTYFVDVTTGNIYASEDEARAAGVAAENIKKELPPSPQLIQSLYNSSDALYNEATANLNRVRE